MVEMPMWGLIAVGVASLVIGVVIGIVVGRIAFTLAVGRAFGWR